MLWNVTIAVGSSNARNQDKIFFPRWEKKENKGNKKEKNEDERTAQQNSYVLIMGCWESGFGIMPWKNKYYGE